jgi:tetratricopeptide (TPR) repeat protein
VENAGRESRYRRLETIRQYAREKLFESEEVALIRDRHLDYFRTLAEKAEIEILHANQTVWLQRLNVEFDNIRAALEWSQENRVEDGLQLGNSIWRFCLRYGYARELVERLNQLLAHPSAAKRTSVRAKTLSTLSILAVWQGDLKKTRPLAEESLAINKELGDQKGLAASLYALGVATNHTGAPEALSFLLQSLAAYRSLDDKRGISEVLIIISQASNDPAQRQASLEESLELARERGDAITMAGALDNLGILALDLGNFAQARFWLEESLALQRPLGASGYFTTLQYLAELDTYEGNYAEARALCEEGLLMSKNAGMRGHQFWLHSILGNIALGEGKWEEARTLLINDLRRFNSAGRTRRMLYTLEGFARMAAHQGQLERATQLFAFAAATREARNYPLVPVDQALIDRALLLVKTQLDDTTFEALWTEGSTMTLEQAVAISLQEYNEPTS